MVKATKVTHPSADRPADLHRRLGDLLRRQGKRYRRNLKRCRQAFSEPAVHDLRVSIRRLLATLELLSACLPARRVEKARRALKRQLDAFDDLRDLQVQLARLAALPLRGRAGRSFRAFLRKRERKAIAQARRRVSGFPSGRVARLTAEFGEALRERSTARAAGGDFPVLLRRANAAFARAAELRARIDPADSDTIHRTRVAFKRYRYAVEALAPQLPEVTPRRLRAMRAHQNRMGDIQDATVLLRSAARFARKKLDPETGGLFLAELERVRRRLILRYLRAADKLGEFGPLGGGLDSRAARNEDEDEGRARARARAAAPGDT